MKTKLTIVLAAVGVALLVALVAMPTHTETKRAFYCPVPYSLNYCSGHQNELYLNKGL